MIEGVNECVCACVRGRVSERKMLMSAREARDLHGGHEPGEIERQNRHGVDGEGRSAKRNTTTLHASEHIRGDKDNKERNYSRRAHRWRHTYEGGEFRKKEVGVSNRERCPRRAALKMIGLRRTGASSVSSARTCASCRLLRWVCHVSCFIYLRSAFMRIRPALTPCSSPVSGFTFQNLCYASCPFPPTRKIELPLPGGYGTLLRTG